MLNLTSLTAADADMPVSKRGRTAEPIPANVLEWVKDSYSGSAKSVKIPHGTTNDDGSDSNVKTFTSVLRRAATSLGLGISVSYGEGNKTSTPVIFKAKDKSVRVRRTRDQIEQDEFLAFYRDNETETFPEEDSENVNAVAAWEIYVNETTE